MRVMAFAGVLMFLIAALGAWLYRRKELERARWFHRTAIAAIALPYIAATAGWILTEMGRQPWIVQGLLLTSKATSPNVSTTWLGISLGVFVALYTLLGIVDFVLMRRYAHPGEPTSTPGPAAAGGHLLMNLQILWFCLIAVLWGGYFVLEGFDFGVGMLLPFLPRDESERGAMFQSIGPVWDGNEVWLVVAAGATFAAFPAWYGTMFSGFYLALLLILFFLIVRVVSFEWREKSDSPRWRRVWMWANAGGSLGIALIWGIGLSNLLHGVPLDSSGDYAGGFSNLFSGYTILGGIAFALVFAFHGAIYLTPRTVGDLCERSRRAARLLAIPAVAVGGGYLIWTIAVAVDRNDKSVFPPVLPAAIAIAAFVLAAVCVYAGRNSIGFTLSAVGTLSLVATLFTSLYPRVMVSSPDFGNSLTVQNTASAHYTLAVVSVVAAICVPLVLLYQGWTYHVFRARVGGDELTGGPETPADSPAA